MEFLIPFIAKADSSTALSVKQLVFRISYNILNPLIKLGIVVALLYFMWQVAEFIRDRNNGGVAATGRTRSGGFEGILWGLFGLFIMISVFGIMNIIASLVGSSLSIQY
jgi:hypothetical protein